MRPIGQNGLELAPEHGPENGSENGSVLVTALFILGVLSILGTAAMNTSNTELDIARNDRLHNQALYLAEAGIEHAKANIMAGNSTDTIPPKTLSVGTYRVTCSDADNYDDDGDGDDDEYDDNYNEGYLVTSTGQAGTASAKLQARFEKPMVYPYQFGVFGNSTIIINGNSEVDSYNSTQGYDESGGGNSGHIGVNDNSSGAITINGNKANVTGNATVGPGGDVNSTIYDSHDGIQGSKSVNSKKWEFRSISSPCSGDPSGDYSVSEDTELTWGSSTYHYDTLDIKGKLKISGETTICVNTLDIINGKVIIEPEAEVKIYITGEMDATGQGLVNEDDDPSSLQIFGTNSASSIDIDVKGQTEFHGTVYAPTADISVKGQGDVYGSLVGDTVDLKGNGGVHYDENLEDIAFETSGELSLVYWKELFGD